MSEFQQLVDIDIFPERYGGKVSQAEIVRETKERLYPLRDKIKALDEMQVDLKMRNIEKSLCKFDANGNIEEPILEYKLRMLQVD